GPLTAFVSIAPGSSALERGCLALMTIWLFHFWPWRVVLDRDGISKRNYFGVKKVLRWTDVVTLMYREHSEDYLVIGRDGTKIWFSPFHVDPVHFEIEVLKNSPVKQ